MTSGWNKTSLLRSGIDTASTVTGAGFSAVKAGTRLGFYITRGITSNAAGLAGYAADHILFGGTLGAGSALKNAVSSAVSFAERLTFIPILFGESITSTSLVAAHSTVNALSVFYPGSDEASFSLASFVELARREWNEPELRQYGPTEIARALVAWGALQGMTSEWKEKEWLKHMREVPVLDHAPRTPISPVGARHSRVRVNSDVILSMNRGQVVTADVGKRASLRVIPASVTPSPRSAPLTHPVTSTRLRRKHQLQRLSVEELKTTLRRLSKLVLAGYGGATLLFFGVSPIPSWQGTSGRARKDEEVNVATAVAASEEEADGTAEDGTDTSDPKYSWWNVLLGRHDQEIFHAFANMPAAKDERQRLEQRARVASTIIGDHNLMPRFWVLKDHGRKEVVLVIRGTMSLNEIAVDLTCEPEPFSPACSDDDSTFDHDTHEIPGFAYFPSKEQSPGKYSVHSGMLRMSRAMGGIGCPVHAALKAALKENPDYDLVLCGHSLGAGVAALLGLTWADPRTCLTVPSSGLPINRRVSVYCFAPPCVTDAALGKLGENLITSLVYSHDVVSRLTVGALQDMRRAAVWLCDANARETSDANAPAEGYASVTTRALKAKAGMGAHDDATWFLSMRKTLEANMGHSALFPPGRVWWAIRDGELHPNNRSLGRSDKGKEKVRLFEVLDAEKIFSQVIFATDLLSSHLPHQYDRVLHELL